MTIKTFDEMLAEHKGSSAPRTQVVNAITFHHIFGGTAGRSHWIAQHDGKVASVWHNWSRRGGVGTTEACIHHASVEGNQMKTRFRSEEGALKAAAEGLNPRVKREHKKHEYRVECPDGHVVMVIDNETGGSIKPSAAMLARMTRAANATR
jgi:hypothetical protein